MHNNVGSVDLSKGTDERELRFYWFPVNSINTFTLFMNEGILHGTRRYQRVSLPKGIFVAWYGGESAVSRVHTLSMGGLFICACKAPPVGTNLRLVFEVPGGSVQADGIVRNIAPGEGMGVEFTWMGHKDRILLERLVKRLLH